MQAILAFAILLFTSWAAEAHSLKALEDDLAKREPAARFNANEAEPFPEFAFKDVQGNTRALRDFQDHVVLLDFLGTAGESNAQIAAFLATLQKDVAVGHMANSVMFVSVTGDPSHENAASLLEFGKRQSLDPTNWLSLTSTDPAKIDELAKKLGVHLKADGDSTTPNDIIYVIDREGHLRARFHGHEFDPVNLVLYTNALVNDMHRGKSIAQTPPTLWQRVKAWFGKGGRQS